MVNVTDTGSVKVNDELTYLSLNIGPDKNHPVIVVDDILEDIDGFIDTFITNVPVEGNRNYDQNTNIPGFSRPLSLFLPEVRKTIGFFINEFTDFEVPNPEDLRFAFQLNVLYSNIEHPRKYIQPHVDPSMFAFVLYLHDGSESGDDGTAFYSHETGGCINMEHVFSKFKREEPYWNYKEWEYDFLEKSEEPVVFDSNNIEPCWKEIHEVPMKKNRLVLYPSYLWHSAKFSAGEYDTNPRVSVSGFVEKDYFI